MGNSDQIENGAFNLENIQETNCDNIASPGAHRSSCQFLRCVPKEKPIYLEMPNDVCADVDDVNSHKELKRTTINDAACSSQDNYHESSQELCPCSYDISTISAEQDQDGTWIVEWNTSNPKDEDFIALCETGKSYRDTCFVYMTI